MTIVVALHANPDSCPGYLSLISVVWPLTACSFLVNNWVEARSDAVKIAIGSQRPIPWRADSIGPWLNSLGFLSWFGSITSTVLLYLFSSQEDTPDGSPGSIRPWALLLCILFAEHMYLLVKNTVHYAMRMMDSPGLQKERAERFSMRKLFLEQTFGPDFAEETPSMIKEHAGGEKLTREALEEEARVASTQGQGSATQQCVTPYSSLINQPPNSISHPLPPIPGPQYRISESTTSYSYVQ